MAIKATAKKPLFGNNRSHALNATRRKQNLNMQTVIVDGKKVVMSVREAKAFKNNKDVKEDKNVEA